MKAVILARISDKEQEEGHSIVAQDQRGHDYCQRKGLTVIRVFHIIESSTRGNREEFHEIFAFIKAQKETIALVADAVDRVQRSFKESVMFDELIRSQALEIHFHREGMVIGKNASATDIMRWDFSVIAAKSYVLQLSENVKRSLDWKLRNGQCIGPAPLGYINTRDAHGKSIVVADPDRAHIISQLFREYATGLFTLGALGKKAKQLGLKTRKGADLGKSSMHLMITNRFYYGEMEIKGQLYSHQYEPLVTRQTFEACQDVLNGWHKKPFKYSGKDFVFRGLLRCAITDQAVWADTKRKTLADGTTAEWTYLVANDPYRPGKKIWVREEEVIDQVKGALKTLYIPDPVFKELVHTMRNGYEAEKKFHEEQLRRIETARKVIDIKLDRLTDLMLDESITPEIHKKKRIELSKRQAELADELKQYQKADESFRASLELLLTVASRSFEIFNHGSIAQKREIINCIFSNQKLNGKTLEYTMRSPFCYWPKKAETEEWLRILDGFRTKPEMRKIIQETANLHYRIAA